MAREVESVHRFEHQRHKHALKKERLILRCDDGAIYEFGKATDAPAFRLVRRFQPDGSLSTSRGVLPAAIKQTANDILGEKSWHK